MYYIRLKVFEISLPTIFIYIGIRISFSIVNKDMSIFVLQSNLLLKIQNFIETENKKNKITC